MNREDITRMAREAGSEDWGIFRDFMPELERFANLVAAAEREAIAKMIEDAPPLVDFAKNEHDGCLICGFTPKLFAFTIRERGAP
jgi:hypothetical protein